MLTWTFGQTKAKTFISHVMHKTEGNIGRVGANSNRDHGVNGETTSSTRSRNGLYTHFDSHGTCCATYILSYDQGQKTENKHV